MTPFSIIILLLIIGLIFIPVGVTMLYSAKSLYDVSIQYGGAGTSSANACAAGSCILTFTLNQQVSGNLYLYYELDNYYQNNIKYSSSVNWAQMMGNANVPMSDLQSTCDPVVLNGTRVLNPCGLVAKSYFQDTFSLNVANSLVGDVVPTGLTMSFNDITGSIDKSLFKQPDGFQSAQAPSACVNWAQQSDGTCASVNMPSGCRCFADPTANVNQYWYYYYPNDATTTYLYEMYPMTSISGISPLLGVTDPHFMNWMNIAALPNFRKLYGVINGNFNTGDVLAFNVYSLVDVNAFNGRKSLVLSSKGSLGVSNNGLGVTYIVTGTICLICSILFFIKQETNPRPPPTPATLKWT
jgi:hypothetical protein